MFGATATAIGVVVFFVAFLVFDARQLKRYSAVLEQALPLDYVKTGRGSYSFEHAGLSWEVFFNPKGFSWQLRIRELLSEEKFSVWSRSYSPTFPPSSGLFKADGMQDYYLMVDAVQFRRFVLPVRDRLERLRALGPFIGMSAHFLCVLFYDPPRDLPVVRQQVEEGMALLLEWRREVAKL